MLKNKINIVVVKFKNNNEILLLKNKILIVRLKKVNQKVSEFLYKNREFFSKIKGLDILNKENFKIIDSFKKQVFLLKIKYDEIKLEINVSNRVV